MHSIRYFPLGGLSFSLFCCMSVPKGGYQGNSRTIGQIQIPRARTAVHYRPCSAVPYLLPGWEWPCGLNTAPWRRFHAVAGTVPWVRPCLGPVMALYSDLALPYHKPSRLSSLRLAVLAAGRPYGGGTPRALSRSPPLEQSHQISVRVIGTSSLVLACRHYRG